MYFQYLFNEKYCILALMKTITICGSMMFFNEIEQPDFKVKIQSDYSNNEIKGNTKFGTFNNSFVENISYYSQYFQ